jgi:phosphotransferase system IIA component
MSTPTDGEIITYRSTNTLKFINDYHKLVFTHNDGFVIMMHPAEIEYLDIYNKLFGLFVKEECLDNITKLLKLFDIDMKEMQKKAFDESETQAIDMVLFIEKLKEVKQEEVERPETSSHAEATSQTET